MVVDFAKRMEMAVVNLIKKEQHRVKYKSGARCKHVEYIFAEETRDNRLQGGGS